MPNQLLSPHLLAHLKTKHDKKSYRKTSFLNSPPVISEAVQRGYVDPQLSKAGRPVSFLLRGLSLSVTSSVWEEEAGIFLLAIPSDRTCLRFMSIVEVHPDRYPRVFVVSGSWRWSLA